MNPNTSKKQESDAGACQHCGALVYREAVRCRQCGKFPIKLHVCQHCKCISAAEVEKCWKCGRVFSPEGDYL